MNKRQIRGGAAPWGWLALGAAGVLGYGVWEWWKIVADMPDDVKNWVVFLAPAIVLATAASTWVMRTSSTKSYVGGINRGLDTGVSGVMNAANRVADLRVSTLARARRVTAAPALSEEPLQLPDPLLTHVDGHHDEIIDL